MKKTFILLGLLLATQARATIMSRDLVDCAGNTSAGHSHKIFDAFGEPVAGQGNSTKHVVASGFLAMEAVQPLPTFSPTPPMTPTSTATRSPYDVDDDKKQLRVYHTQINPSRGERARIQWYQPNDRPVTIKIYTILGDEVTTIVRGQSYTQGQLHSEYWDGRNSGGNKCASGIYIVYLSAGEYMSYSKAAVIK